MFRDNLSVPSSGVKNPESRILKMGPIGCPETSVTNYYSLRNKPEKRISQLLLIKHMALWFGKLRKQVLVSCCKVLLQHLTGEIVTKIT